MRNWSGRAPRVVRGTALRVRNARIKARDGYQCQMCGAVRIPEDLEIDHIVPVCRGGGDEDSNLQSLCKSPCHELKTAKDMGWKPKPPVDVDGWPVTSGESDEHRPTDTDTGGARHRHSQGYRGGGQKNYLLNQ